LLERAAEEGHSLLDEARLRKRLAQLSVDPPCDPTTAVFEIAARSFRPALVEQLLGGGHGRAWQLDRLARTSDLIADEVTKRLETGPIEVEWEWRAAIDAAIDEQFDPADAEEERARAEKALALNKLARARIGVLVGPAGTGKTTMLQALCTHPDVANRGVLLLAPTGKARVQLGDKVGARAMTL
jgi:hypothetical protein